MKQSLVSSFIKLVAGYSTMAAGYLAQYHEQGYLALLLFAVALYFFISSWYEG